MNLDFIKEILTSEFEYYLVSMVGVKSVMNNYVDKVILIRLPDSILTQKYILQKNKLDVGDMKLEDIEIINYTIIESNIYLTDMFPPFQNNVCVNRIHWYQGLDGDIRQFMVDALARNGEGNWSDFIELINK